MKINKYGEVKITRNKIYVSNWDIENELDTKAIGVSSFSEWATLWAITRLADQISLSLLPANADHEMSQYGKN